MRDNYTSPHVRAASIEAASRRYWRRPTFAKLAMKRNLRATLFGFWKRQRADTSAADISAKKKRTLATVNESETTADKPPRVNRTIGLTEQRLRARNQRSWMTSTKGWSNVFGRFTRFGS